MDLSYFVVTCEETDLFDGKIVRVNKKARDIDEVCLILKTYFNQYPAAHWEMYPCHVQI
ncbi:MAG: hypothetical protein HFI45_15470 [Lachnospiraceae bacterium]|mgnify:CR=1 FL=1|nr:hypothetical protein [Lachnospiraceae bacterium]